MDLGLTVLHKRGSGNSSVLRGHRLWWRRRRPTLYCRLCGHHNGAAVHWVSQDQKTITLSSNDPKDVVMCRAAREVGFLLHLGSTLKVEQHQATAIYEDNEGEISNAKGKSSSMHSRNMAVQYHCTREKLKRVLIQILHNVSKEQPADILTKNSDVALRRYFRKLVLTD